QLGVKGGVGYAYEYGGDVIDRMTMEERLTLCNMSIEGGARFGYVNPDATTIDYLRGRPYAPQGAAFDRAATWWKTIATESGAAFDDVKRIDGNALEPGVTWGINPEMSVGVSQRIPAPRSRSRARLPSPCARSSCPAPSRWPRPPRPRACTRSFSRPASSGARPAARCVWE